MAVGQELKLNIIQTLDIVIASKHEYLQLQALSLRPATGYASFGSVPKSLRKGNVNPLGILKYLKIFMSIYKMEQKMEHTHGA